MSLGRFGSLNLLKVDNRWDGDVLKDKVAVVYGAGRIGSAVSRAFAAAGAQVHLATAPT
jgi:phosphoglycerate dehydrogenase-like enzyme